MSNLVSKLHIIDKNFTIFDSDMGYIIPLYQRAFAWEDKHLMQLIEDIKDVQENMIYYLGSLIVSRQNSKYEVIDGQQRLTALYLLLNCLNVKVNHTLTFACRDKSNYTLKNIKKLFENRSALDMDKIEPNIQKAVTFLSRELEKKDFDKEAFIKKLANVVIYRIEVPENTDLNRYFEIMNTRGEQLEQHDILKATLMSFLSNASESEVFAKIWNACSDMTGYVQMHFSSKNNMIRDGLFGSAWNVIPQNSWKECKQTIKSDTEKTAGGYQICELIDENFRVNNDDGYLEEDENTRVRFESIIEFPYFLLHTLKVFIRLYGIEHKDGKTKLVDDLLDDKKLLEVFDNVMKNGISKGVEIAQNKGEFARKFIVCLLRTRYLFDKYIIKREYTNDNGDGTWSLKSLYVSGQQSKKKAYYKNTEFYQLYERSSTRELRAKKNIMIQSALRVSYTSPKVMHWITQLLIWLSETDCNKMVDFNEVAESIAKKAVKSNFFDCCEDNKYTMGVYTPHIVFNYLDYLLWCEDQENEKEYNDFVFEFRNSVEHWYPQHPSEGTFEQWKDGVDTFGNLCLIQKNINSKFSNMAPEAKKSTFKDMIDKGSLKLRIMNDMTEKHGDKTASSYWKDEACQKHEDKMITRLREAVE